jgi:hypothetical protein
MEGQHLVVLFGDFLFMDAVEASLEDDPKLGVMRIHTNVTDVGELLKSLSPDLIIMELNAPYAQFVLPFLRDLPDVTILCLDVTCSKVVILESEQHTIRTASDLLRVIGHHVPKGQISDVAAAPDEHANRMESMLRFTGHTPSGRLH